MIRGARRIVFVLGAVAWGLGSARAFIGISPAVVELRLATGGAYRGEFWLSNTRETPLRVTVEAAETWAEKTGLGALPLAQWFQLKNPGVLTLAPHARKRVRFRVRLPADYQGEAMATVFFEYVDPTERVGPMSLQMRQGIPIYVTALGTERPELRLRPLVAGLLASAAKSVCAVSVTVENTGNVHLRPRGDLRIESLDGGVSESASLQYGIPVFPGREQAYAAEVARDDWPAGRYRAVVRVAPGDLFPGPAEEASLMFDVKDGRVAPINDGKDRRTP